MGGCFLQTYRPSHLSLGQRHHCDAYWNSGQLYHYPETCTCKQHGLRQNYWGQPSLLPGKSWYEGYLSSIRGESLLLYLLRLQMTGESHRMAAVC